MTPKEQDKLNKLYQIVKEFRDFCGRVKIDPSIIRKDDLKVSPFYHGQEYAYNAVLEMLEDYFSMEHTP